MNVEELEKLIDQETDALKVKRVFGEPIVQDGLTIIPVAKVRGAGGAGSGTGPGAKGEGKGAGFAMTARAMGAYVIKGGEVRFVPAIDVNRAILVAGAVMCVMACTIGRPVAKALIRR